MGPLFSLLVESSKEPVKATKECPIRAYKLGFTNPYNYKLARGDRADMIGTSVWIGS